MTPEDKKKLLDQLNALKKFPNNKLVKQLRKQIQKNTHVILKTWLRKSKRSMYQVREFVLETLGF